MTNTQTVVDAPNTKKSDLRRARSALMNLAPTSTGSATAIALIFPELTGKLNGLAVRVPLLNASITDCVFEVNRETSVEEVNALLKEAADTYLKDILGYEERPLVSTDYINDPRSSIVDALSTQVIDGTMVKIYAWYDNEYGYRYESLHTHTDVVHPCTSNTKTTLLYHRIFETFFIFQIRSIQIVCFNVCMD